MNFSEIMYAQRNDSWDLSIYNRELQLVLAVEVKSQLNITKEWATKFRRNVLAHGVFALAPYFLIIFPDVLYLWTDDNGVLPLKEPTYTVDARPIFRPYFEQSGITANQISSENLEIIVTSWLAKIMYSSKPPSLDDESHGWLVDSGLYNAIAGGISQPTNWLQQITGSFKDEPAFEEVLAYGRAIRQGDELLLEG